MRNWRQWPNASTDAGTVAVEPRLCDMRSVPVVRAEFSQHLGALDMLGDPPSVCSVQAGGGRVCHHSFRPHLDWHAHITPDITPDRARISAAKAPAAKAVPAGGLGYPEDIRSMPTTHLPLGTKDPYSAPARADHSSRTRSDAVSHRFPVSHDTDHVAGPAGQVRGQVCCQGGGGAAGRGHHTICPKLTSASVTQNIAQHEMAAPLGASETCRFVMPGAMQHPRLT